MSNEPFSCSKHPFKHFYERSHVQITAISCESHLGLDTFCFQVNWNCVCSDISGYSQMCWSWLVCDSRGDRDWKVDVIYIRVNHTTVTSGQHCNYMWCDQAKSVWSRSYSIFNFFILQKTPLKLNNQFKRYQQLKSLQNKRKQKEILPLFGYISKSIFPTSDWFCLITPHICISPVCLFVNPLLVLCFHSLYQCQVNTLY